VAGLFTGTKLKMGLQNEWHLWIDQTTVHSLIYGITRSGKGETIVLSLIDNLSRAKKQLSI